MDVENALIYLDFVEERHRIWEHRQFGWQQPWTADPYLAAHKFTNVFRILDHGSQFVMTDLIDPELSDRDQLARLFLYRHTGRVEVWQHLEMITGYPTVDNLDDVLACWQDYRGEAKITMRGQEARNRPGEKRVFTRSVFTGAYLVFPQSDTPGTDKLESIIDLTKRLFTPGSPQDIMPSFREASTQQQRFLSMRSQKGVADFMSMQILTDWGWTPHCGEDRENDFVVLGPGARKGAAALGLSAQAGIEWAVDQVRSSPDCPMLGNRPPSWMDVQNTLCEFSKLVRFRSKPAPAKPYRPAHAGPQPSPVLPEHW